MRSEPHAAGRVSRQLLYRRARPGDPAARSRRALRGTQFDRPAAPGAAAVRADSMLIEATRLVNTPSDAPPLGYTSRFCIAISTARVRSFTPSLEKMFETWLRTVPS